VFRLRPCRFHLHGHVFEVTAIGGVEFRGANRDSVIVDPGECATTEICFEANNPGVWPLHCHMSCKAAPLTSTRVPNVRRVPGYRVLFGSFDAHSDACPLFSDHLGAGMMTTVEYTDEFLT
jgi:hypothetical protein